jgi:multicomponent Na+:H+ antiporter subunit B
MKTLIFSTAIKILTPLFLLFSLYVFVRGHNHPGGGFIGGLMVAISFMFHVLAHGSKRTSKDYFSLILYGYNRKPEELRRAYYKNIFNANILHRHTERSKEQDWKYYLIRLRPSLLIAFGLILTVISGTIGLVMGKPFLTGIWFGAEIPLVGGLGTPLLFDLGVYFLVLGMVLKMIFTMSKE